MGVSILPRFAAMVCKTTTGITSCRLASGPIMFRTISVNGTKVISATSFVTSILEKKQSNTRISTSCHALPPLPKSAWATHRNTPLFCSPAMTLIRQNRNASVRKSHSPDILCQGLQKAWNSNPSISGSILYCMRCWTAAWKILRSTFPMTNEGVPVSTPSAFISYI